MESEGSPSIDLHSDSSVFAEALAQGASLADGFARAMGLMEARLGAKSAALFLADAGRQVLTVEAVYGMSPQELRPRYGVGVAGRVAESGRPVVVPAAHNEPMALSERADAETWSNDRWSLVAVPIAGVGRSLGALSVYFPFHASATFAVRLRAVTAVANELGRAFGAAPWHAPLRTRGTQDPANEVKGSNETTEASQRAVFEYANMIGTSPLMRQVYEEIGQVAQTTATALILGESGTGKELVAQAIHTNSERVQQPFIKINSAAFPDTLFESELFGHERGAFTGAVGRKKGRIDRAQGGTLFLDEIGDLPLSTQVKLLRVIQTREYERLGGTETLKADVRIIAATNKNMQAAVASGTFREDLYYRLNVFTITLPALRERKVDVPLLAEYFLDKYAREHRRKVRRISSGTLDLLCQHQWPGNVRELENAIERAVVACTGLVIEERHLPEVLRGLKRGEGTSSPRSLQEAVKQLEVQMIEGALRESEGNLARAARALGTSERILRYKVNKYRIEPPRKRSSEPAPAPDAPGERAATNGAARGGHSETS
jgi:Nif-specific regulatory protein